MLVTIELSYPSTNNQTKSQNPTQKMHFHSNSKFFQKCSLSCSSVHILLWPGSCIVSIYLFRWKVRSVLRYAKLFLIMFSFPIFAKIRKYGWKMCCLFRWWVGVGGQVESTQYSLYMETRQFSKRTEDRISCVREGAGGSKQL